MTTNLSNEQLIKKLQHRIAVAASYPDVEEAQFDATIFKIALASLEAKPVVWTDDEELRDATTMGCGYIFSLDNDAGKFADPRRQIMLYAAPPYSQQHHTMRKPREELNDRP
jgi:hypothetical protein